MAAEPVPTESPRRPTGAIPLSWAVPAEAVSSGPLPRQSSKPVFAVVLGAIAAVGTIAVLGALASSPSTPVPVPAPVPAAAVQPAPAPAPLPAVPAPTPGVPPAVTPAPSVDVQPVAAAEAAAHAVTPAARARARQLIQRARVLAKDGKVAQAHDVAEDAIAADPECGSCWKTVALLRKKTGDRAGATLAKARADALGDDDTP